MKRLIAIAVIVISTSACAQHGHYRGSYGYGHQHGINPWAAAAIIGTGAAMYYATRPAPPPAVIYQPAPVYAGPRRLPEYAAPLSNRGGQCPNINGYQTVPVIVYGRNGYIDNQYCGWPQ